MSTMQQTTVNSQPSTSTTTSTSTYAFVPSTAAACGSELLYLAKVYTESLQMYSEQISNELDAGLRFATSAAKELENQGQDALNSVFPMFKSDGTFNSAECEWNPRISMLAPDIT